MSRRLWGMLGGILLWAGFPEAARAGQAGPLQGASTAPDTSYGCTVCHAEHRQALTSGVHAESGIRCADCHGGDPQARELPAAHRGAFTSARGKVATAQLCGSCHADPNRMRQYGLPTGQLAEFRTSRHGQLLFQRQDPNAPTCTSCHGTHVIYRPDDGRSSVYPGNIPATCSACHSDRQLMGQYRLPVDQLHEYRQSAHGVALFEGGNFAAPTCVGCHGAHSALPPGTLEVANVCSRCHQLVGQATALGPHGAAARAGKFPGCLGCHSNHRTERIPPDSTAGLCQKCHADDSRIREVGLDIQRLMTQASSDLRSAERAVERLRVDGRRTGDHRFRYQSALSYYLQIAQVQHSLDLERLEDLGRRVRSTSVQLGAAAEVSAERRWEQKLILLPVWFLALSAVALALLILRAVRVRKGVEES